MGLREQFEAVLGLRPGTTRSAPPAQQIKQTRNIAAGRPVSYGGYTPTVSRSIPQKPSIQDQVRDALISGKPTGNPIVDALTGNTKQQQDLAQQISEQTQKAREQLNSYIGSLSGPKKSGVSYNDYRNLVGDDAAGEIGPDRFNKLSQQKRQEFVRKFQSWKLLNGRNPVETLIGMGKLSSGGIGEAQKAPIATGFNEPVSMGGKEMSEWGKHNGIDLVATPGTPILSPEAGKFTWEVGRDGNRALRFKGMSGVSTVMAHVKDSPYRGAVNKFVGPGQVIGYTGAGYTGAGEDSWGDGYPNHTHVSSRIPQGWAAPSMEYVGQRPGLFNDPRKYLGL